MDTFPLIATITTSMLLLPLAALWELYQFDINNAFLNRELFKEIYMDIPQGYPVKGEPLACRLNKSIYGLKQTSSSGSLSSQQHLFPMVSHNLFMITVCLQRVVVVLLWLCLFMSMT